MPGKWDVPNLPDSCFSRKVYCPGRKVRGAAPRSGMRVERIPELRSEELLCQRHDDARGASHVAEPVLFLVDE